MPQPYNIKTSSNKPSLGSTNVKKTPVTLMTQMYKPEKKDKPKSGVKKYNDEKQGTKRPLF